METPNSFPNVTTAPDNYRFYVSRKYESLDYDRLDSEVLVEEEDLRGESFVFLTIIKRGVIFLLIGVLSAVFATVIEVIIFYGNKMRFSFLFDETYNYLETNFLKMCMLWTISIFIPAFIAAVLVAYGEPMAAGGVNHLVLSYLNGINLGTFMKFKVTIIKTISVILTVISGLPAGKAAPMVSIGTTIGCITPLMSFGDYQPFNYFYQDAEMRDMAAAGAAAGYTAAFGTPIASIMFSFEETLTFWNAELTFLIFIATLASFFTLKFLINTIIYDCIDCVGTKENLYLQTMKDPDKTYSLFEIPLFFLFGIIGGISGGVFNLLLEKLRFYRKRYVGTPAKKLTEVTLVAIINGIIQISLVKSLSDDCIPHTGKGNFTETRTKPSRIKLNCKKENEFSAAGLFFFQLAGGVFRDLFTKNEVPLGLKPLAIFGLYYYLGSCLVAGCQVTHGIFIPNIVVGNIWGRSIAELINNFFPNSTSWARPNKYAFLCGASQLCGTLRQTFTICVMMLESCNNVKLGIPIFIVVFTSRFVGDFITMPIGRKVCSDLGIPLLEREPPPLLTHIKVKDILTKEPLVTLPPAPTLAIMKNVLTSNNHNGFPIVSTGGKTVEENVQSYGSLIGLISRTQIKGLLKHHTKFTEEDFLLKKKLKILRNEHASILMSEPINIQEDEEKMVIDLEPYMNSTPYFVHMKSSLPHAYRTFAGLGLRHLIVVNSQCEVVGIITRKDLSVFRFIRYGRHMEIMKLPVRD